MVGLNGEDRNECLTIKRLLALDKYASIFNP
jgi:hypothetical protein